MRLLYVHASAPSDGSQIHARSFVSAYRNSGEPITEIWIPYRLMAGQRSSWSLARRLLAKALWASTSARAVFALATATLRDRPDVILFRFDPMHRLAAAIVFASIFFPVVLEINAVRSIENPTGRPGLSDWLDRLMLRRARASFAVSDVLRRHLLSYYKVFPSKVSVVENGVDESHFNPMATTAGVRQKLGLHDAFIVGFVGSFRPWHGVHGLVDIAKVTSSRTSDVHFVLVGDGPERPALEAKVRSEGLSPYIHFLGFLPHKDIPGILAEADALMAPLPAAAFVHGFYGSALKIFEYMAMAKPVIAPPLGQIAEVMDHGISGYLVASEDVEAVVEVLLELKAQPELRASVGEQARKRVVESYTWRENARRVRVLCEEALHGA